MTKVWTLALALLVTASPTAQASEKPGRLQGTYVQLWRSHQTWDDAAWEKLFACFEHLRLREIIVQFSQVNELSLLDASADPDRPPVIQTVLRLAKRHHIKVWLGLYADLKYFDNVQREPQELGAYLGSLRAKSLAVARRLAETMGKNPEFVGWYLSEEIHDESFSDPERKQQLWAHLGALSDGLHRITPKKKIGISGFSNGTLPANAVGAFWRELLAAAAIDTVFFQDGIGAHKLTLDTLPNLLRAVRAAVTGEKREFRVVVETFREGPKEDDRFTATPAPWHELRQQLSIARAVAGAGIVAFSVPEYLWPESGEQAKALFEAYLQGTGLATH